MDEYILSMNNIVKTFPGVKALKDGCFKLKRGEIHALIGENGAGKSTLMKILMGDYGADSGEIVYKGKKHHVTSPRDAEQQGICIIPQEVNIVDTADVAENIWLGREKNFSTCGFIHKNKRLQATQSLFDEIGISLNPTDMGKSLSPAKKQLLTIAKVVSYGADIIIMDEPTSSLTGTEVDVLFDIMRKLRDEGASIVFISHKLEEIYTICERITVMRDGEFIGEFTPEEINQDQLVTKIAGREIASQYPPKGHSFGNTVLQVNNLTTDNVFKDISFEIHEGEILGFYGLVGAGRSEIMRAVFGIDKYSSGSIHACGKLLPSGKPDISVRCGLAMVTEDRLQSGIISMQSVRTNVSIANLYRMINGFGFVKTKEEYSEVQDITERLSVKCASIEQTIGGLSGGNQQKAILGRWMLTNPKVLILDEPTRGIDVGAKADIYALIADLAAQGMAVIVISSELQEVIGLANRVIVVKEGTVTKTFFESELNQEDIVTAAFGIIEESKVKEK